MKAVKYIAVSVLILFIITQAAFSPQEYKETQFCMDTVANITVYGSGAKKAAQAAFARIYEVEKKFSAYRDGSEIYKINNSPHNEFVETDEEVYQLIERALEFSHLTDGAFDITLKPISDLWGIGTENAKVPNTDELEETLLKTGWQNVELCKESHSVKLKKEGMALDLGAIAKGYAADEAMRVLRENGIENACVDIGGDIAVMGKKPLGLIDSVRYKSRTRPFQIGIQDPSASHGSIFKTVDVNEDLCVVTSGDYERYFEQDGVRYHHIFDSKTGAPAKSGVHSVTVIAKDAVTADALSTAFFVMGNDAEGKFKEYYDKLILVP